MEKSANTKLIAPDGGYGWVATLGVSLINVSNYHISVNNEEICFGDDSFAILLVTDHMKHKFSCVN